MAKFSLAPWFFLGCVSSGCGSEPPRHEPPVDSHTDSAVDWSPTIASSDAAPDTSSTTASSAGSTSSVGANAQSAAAQGAVSSSTASGAGGSAGASTGHGEPASSATGSQAQGSGGMAGGSASAGAGAAGQGGEGVSEPPAPEVPVGSLLLTEYVESQSYDKAVELTNVSEQDLSLSACQLLIYFNGNPEPGSKIGLSGELAPHTSLVACHSRSSEPILSVCQVPSGNISFDGNDAVVLACDGNVHDSLGELGVLPDPVWKDQTWRRSCEALPRTDPLSDFDISAEWVRVADEQALTGLGDPTCAEPAQPSEP